LKPNQLRRIEKLYARRIAPQQIVTPEFARQVSELSHETGRQIGALIDRKGYVEYVVVGDARQIELPDLKRTRVAVSIRILPTRARFFPYTTLLIKASSIRLPCLLWAFIRRKIKICF